MPDTRAGEKKTIWVKDLNNARTIQVGYKHNTRLSVNQGVRVKKGINYTIIK